MTVGGLVRETVLLRRAYDCDHDWQPYAEPVPPPPSVGTGPAEQCTKCTVIVTAEGKKNLLAAADRFHGRPPR